jgi:hypothetical protein
VEGRCCQGKHPHGLDESESEVILKPEGACGNEKFFRTLIFGFGYSKNGRTPHEHLDWCGLFCFEGRVDWWFVGSRF